MSHNIKIVLHGVECFKYVIVFLLFPPKMLDCNFSWVLINMQLVFQENFQSWDQD